MRTALGRRSLAGFELVGTEQMGTAPVDTDRAPRAGFQQGFRSARTTCHLPGHTPKVAGNPARQPEAPPARCPHLIRPRSKVSRVEDH